ncbi:deaminase domain-containing protein [Pigmentibacter sp. JX0631]|uniref:deaminase domain-containing protein n=1 Tax=Pigmentibacter sp. JX0631 TaxID=2976982 RepID=UPI0024697290|nr:deaminase domain-containing protein [Pigmentibacter sp. JX0631]WGL58877.1 deaminase domain-containing protein [Pigmentibacter sp. JX0631]
MKKNIAIYYIPLGFIFQQQALPMQCQITEKQIPTIKQIPLSNESEAYRGYKVALDKIKNHAKNKNIIGASYAELINVSKKQVKKFYAVHSEDGFNNVKNSAFNEVYINEMRREDPDLKIINRISKETLQKNEQYILNIYTYNHRLGMNKTNEYLQNFYKNTKQYNIKSKIYLSSNTDLVLEKTHFNTNYAIIENTANNNELYTFISKQSEFIPVKSDTKGANLFSINDALTKFTGADSVYYLHVLVPTIASEVNSWFHNKQTSSYKLEQDGQILNYNIKKYKISAGEIHPVDIISIELKEAKKQYNLYNSLLIKKEDAQNNKSAIFQVKFDKPNSFIEPRNILTDTTPGKRHFDTFKAAFDKIKVKIKNPLETTFKEKHLVEESRKKFLSELNPLNKTKIRTVSYAVLELSTNSSTLIGEIPNEYFTVSGSNITFKNNENSKQYFANYTNENTKLPAFKVEDKNNFFLNEVNSLQSNLEKDQLIDSSLREINTNQREADAEIKILETLLNKTEKTGINTEGKLTIYSSLPVCLSCTNAFHYFNRLRPEIKVDILQIHPKNMKELYN